MKLQSLGIIFVIIILPMIIVLSYYIQLEVDTITLQTSYDTKLLNATYGAVSSFELNTANEDLSNVADSLRSIIEASNNIFFNTLATNFGMSNSNKSLIRSYIPGILYTLYDGYYIYTPTEQPMIRKYGFEYRVEGNDVIEKAMDDTDYDRLISGVSASEKTAKIERLKSKAGRPIYSDEPDRVIYGDDNIAEDGLLRYVKKNGSAVDFVTDINEKDIKYVKDYMIKSYMPYTAHYVSDDINVSINYTLDNYINIIGNIGDIYYTKTGYLISSSEMVDNNDIRTDDNINLLDFNEDSAEEYITSGKHDIEIELTDKETNRKVRISVEKTRCFVI